MFDRFDREWTFVGAVWLDEDDYDEFHVNCTCTSKELKYLKRLMLAADTIVADEYGKYSQDKAAKLMDEMVSVNAKLDDFRQRAYRATLEGAKEYIKTMGKRSEVRPKEKDMMEAPDLYSLRVACHYYNRDIL